MKILKVIKTTNEKIKDLADLYKEKYKKRIVRNAEIEIMYKCENEGDHYWYITGGWDDERKNKISSSFIRSRN